jgi:hypothetical protein
LGYPVTLADTRRHLFCRWDALPRGECFNIEASGEGVSFFPDDHYRTGQHKLSTDDEAAFGFLESLSPQGELAVFLCQRGACWAQEGDFGRAALALAWAHELHPERQRYGLLAVQAVNDWQTAVQARLPSRLFPNLDLGLPAPQFLRLPRPTERELIALRVTERLLNDPDMERRWWEPLRRRPWVRPAGMPDVLSVNYRWNRAGRVASANR